MEFESVSQITHSSQPFNSWLVPSPSHRPSFTLATSASCSHRLPSLRVGSLLSPAVRSGVLTTTRPLFAKLMSKRPLSSTSFLASPTQSPSSRAHFSSKQSASSFTSPSSHSLRIPALQPMNDQLEWRAGPSRDARGYGTENANDSTRGRPNNRRGASRSRSSRPPTFRPPKQSTLPVRDPPLCNSEYVHSLWTGSSPPRIQWIDNPKGVISNYVQALTQNTPQYSAEKS